MSEHVSHRASTPEDEAGESGATSEGFGNLSSEDDALDAWDGGRMSEDAEPATTHENAGNTAQGSLEGTAGPERTDTADNLKTE
jgi:hypothetical protein